MKILTLEPRLDCLHLSLLDFLYFSLCGLVQLRGIRNVTQRKNLEVLVSGQGSLSLHQVQEAAVEGLLLLQVVAVGGTKDFQNLRLQIEDFRLLPFT